jgi:hypothetical protein
MHFLAAGFEPEELFGAYIAEDRGQTVWLYPGQKALRYLVPFGKVEDVIVYLRDAASTPTSTPISPARGANLSRELRLLCWLSVNGNYSHDDTRVLQSPNAFDPVRMLALRRRHAAGTHRAGRAHTAPGHG